MSAVEVIADRVAAPTEPRTTGCHRGVSVLVASTALGVVLLGHRLVPGSAGSGLDSALPWLVVPILLLMARAVLSHRPRLVAATMAPALIWFLTFAPVLTDSADRRAYDLRVASLNLGAAAPGAGLRPLLDTGADIIVLLEITEANRRGVVAELGERYPYEAAAGTVGVFSRLPLYDTEQVDIGIGWTRALRTTVGTETGPIRMYAAHLASARLGRTADRDRTLAALAATVHADPSPQLLLAGDLNTTTTDRQFASLAPLRDTQQQAGSGFGFTWPAALPVVRPDHLLHRGLTTARAWVVRAPGSDHRAVLADLITSSP